MPMNQRWYTLLYPIGYSFQQLNIKDMHVLQIELKDQFLVLTLGNDRLQNFMNFGFGLGFAYLSTVGFGFG